jgi:glycosyltransferase involved in cell wall biosynthesis
MRVHLVDPRGDVTPYDHALAAALARAGVDVELVTSRFIYGPIPQERAYALSEDFYRRGTGRGLEANRLRRATKLLEHVPDMLRYRRRAGVADVRHYQWLPLEAIDSLLLSRARPNVMTMHNVLRRGERPGSALVTRRLAQSMDAVIVHTRHGAARLVELGVDRARVRVIPHGAFHGLTERADEQPLPDELAAVEGPVILSFGRVRDYKGVDVLIEALRDLDGAELWVVGSPLDYDMAPLHGLAAQVPGRVRFVSRYLSEAEVPAYFRRADVLALPHRTVDQSGVLNAGLAFGKPMVASAVGGFVEVAEDHGAVRLVPPGDSRALAAELRRLIADPDERGRLGERAAAAAAGPLSWDEVARQTAALYEELLA